MNIIAIMGPHGVYYKDEPIKELEAALQRQGFQTIWPQNSADLCNLSSIIRGSAGLFLTGMNTALICAAILIA